MNESEKDNLEYEQALRRKKAAILILLVAGLLIGTATYGGIQYFKHQEALKPFEPCNYMKYDTNQWRCCAMCLNIDYPEWEIDNNCICSKTINGSRFKVVI